MSSKNHTEYQVYPSQIYCPVCGDNGLFFCTYADYCEDQDCELIHNNDMYYCENCKSVINGIALSKLLEKQ